MNDRHVPTASLAKSRRVFLQGSAMLLGAACLAEPIAAAAESCQPTEPQVLGPFYRFGAPSQSKLAGPEEPGERLVLTGTVYSSDCRTPLPGALIEIWQANHAGLYDTDKPGNFTERAAFRLRGLLHADKRGEYEIETIVPGRYPIPPGLPGLEKYAGLTRPAHIHFRVIDGLHIPLTTQLYFKGDAFIATDPWASQQRKLAIDLKQQGRFLRGNFDIVLSNGL